MGVGPVRFHPDMLKKKKTAFVFSVDAALQDDLRRALLDRSPEIFTQADKDDSLLAVFARDSGPAEFLHLTAEHFGYAGLKLQTEGFTAWQSDEITETIILISKVIADILRRKKIVQQMTGQGKYPNLSDPDRNYRCFTLAESVSDIAIDTSNEEGLVDYFSFIKSLLKLLVNTLLADKCIVWFSHTDKRIV
ncbi:MAG: hypothetical protein R3C11_29050 [Planctomycetaceae bacterium]